MVMRETKSRGAKFSLVILPRVSECVSGQYNYDISEFPYHDIMESFPKDADALRQLTLGKDRHWNPQGHRVAAGAIVETLLREGLVDEQYLKRKPQETDGE